MQEPSFIAIGGGLAGAAFAAENARVPRGTRGAHHKVCGKLLSAEAHFRIIHDLRLPVVAAEIGQHDGQFLYGLIAFFADQIIVHDKNDAEPAWRNPSS